MSLNNDEVKKLYEVHYKAYHNFEFFCSDVLGLKRNDDIGFVDLNKENRDLCSSLGRTDWKSMIVLTPRYSFKSAICTVGFALWTLIRDPNHRILIYSDTATKAQGFLNGIKNHILGKAPNSKFSFYYPKWEVDFHKDKWSESEIVISKRDFAYIEPSIDTAGIESTKVGRHYPLIIFDDIVTMLNITTKAQMDKVMDCYRDALALLNPQGRVLLVGTRWSYNDAYGRIITENKESKSFKEFIRDADTLGEDGRPIYADIGLDEEFLKEKKEKLSAYSYSCIYKNNPVDDENAIFHSDDFEFYTPSEDFHKNMWVTGTCDPAGEGADFTAITVCATDNKMNLYLLDAINTRGMKPTQIVDAIIRLQYKWGMDKFSIEKNFYKGALEKDYKLMVEQHRENKNYKPLRIEEDIVSTRTARNHERIMSLEPIIRSHRFHLPGKDLQSLPKTLDELTYQIMMYTNNGSKSPHDDLLVSLAFHVDLMRKGGEAPEKAVEENTAAWHLEQAIERQNELQWRRPPSARRQFVNPFK